MDNQMPLETSQAPREALATIIYRLTHRPQCSRRLIVNLAQAALNAPPAAVDLAAFSDEDLNAEFMRRIRLKRDPANAGRKKMLKPCPLGCGNEFGARDLRAHIPVCRQEQKGEN